jgi:hypothetical protein
MINRAIGIQSRSYLPFLNVRACSEDVLFGAGKPPANMQDNTPSSVVTQVQQKHQAARPNEKTPTPYFRDYKGKANSILVLLAALGLAPSVYHVSKPAEVTSPPETVQTDTSATGQIHWQKIGPGGWALFLENSYGFSSEGKFFSAVESLFQKANQAYLEKNAAKPLSPEMQKSLKQLPWQDVESLSRDLVTFLQSKAAESKIALSDMLSGHLKDIPLLPEFIEKHPVLNTLNAGQKIELEKSLRLCFSSEYYKDRSTTYKDAFRMALAKQAGFDNLREYDSNWDRDDVPKLVATLVNNSPALKSLKEEDKAHYQQEVTTLIQKGIDEKPMLFSRSGPISPLWFMIPGGMLSAISLIALGIRKTEKNRYGQKIYYDASEGVYVDLIKMPFRFVQRLQNEKVTFTPLTASENTQATMIVAQLNQQFQTIAGCIEESVKTLPELQEYLNALNTTHETTFPTPASMMNVSLDSVLEPLLDSPASFAEKRTGQKNIPAFRIFEKLAQYVTSAAESHQYMPFLIPTESDDLQQLAKKKKLTLDEAKQLNRFEITKARAIIVSLGVGYQQARSSYIAEAQKLDAQKAQVNQAAQSTGVMADIELVEKHQTLSMLQQATDVAKQRFQLYFELFTRSKQYFNRVMEKKNQLDIQTNQLAIAASAKTLDKAIGGTTEYRLEDVDGMLKELQFKNMKEQVRVEMNAEEIRKKLQTDAVLKQTES